MIDFFAIGGNVPLAERLKDYCVDVRRCDDGRLCVKIMWIRPTEVAKILNMEYGQVYYWYHKKGFGGTKIDGHVYFDVDGLLLYLKENPKRRMWQYNTLKSAIDALETQIKEEIRRVDPRGLDEIGRGLVTVE